MCDVCISSSSLSLNQTKYQSNGTVHSTIESQSAPCRPNVTEICFDTRLCLQAKKKQEGREKKYYSKDVHRLRTHKGNALDTLNDLLRICSTQPSLPPLSLPSISHTRTDTHNKMRLTRKQVRRNNIHRIIDKPTFSYKSVDLYRFSFDPT